MLNTNRINKIKENVAQIDEVFIKDARSDISYLLDLVERLEFELSIRENEDA